MKIPLLQVSWLLPRWAGISIRQGQGQIVSGPPERSKQTFIRADQPATLIAMNISSSPFICFCFSVYEVLMIAGMVFH